MDNERDILDNKGMNLEGVKEYLLFNGDIRHKHPMISIENHFIDEKTIDYIWQVAQAESQVEIERLKKQLSGGFSELSDYGRTVTRLNKENANLRAKLEAVERLLLSIHLNDKTPAYGYDGKTSDLDREGEKPKQGQRWLTPAEMVRQYFGVNFWDKYNRTPRGKNDSTTN